MILVEVGSTGGSTSDTVTINHLTAVTAMYGAQFTHSSGAYDTTAVANTPQLYIGSSANNVQINRSSLTTADAFRFLVEGR